MIKITLYIWQLGVNIIGLPNLYKCELTYKENKSRYFGVYKIKEKNIIPFRI